MSILINDIEMPKEGRLTLQICVDGAVYVVNNCSITAETYTTDAVSVPPHGDLIDRDEQIERAWRLNLYAKELIKMMLTTAPVIIPADDKNIKVLEDESDMDSFIHMFKEDDEEDEMDSFIRIFKD